MLVPESAGVSRETLVAWLKSAAPQVSVGLMAADAMAYGQAVRDLEGAGVPLLHYDIMDGVFCPQMTSGAGLVKATATQMLKDVHLMVDDPLNHLPAVINAGADIVHVHPEGQKHVHRAFVELDVPVQGCATERKILRAVALNPGTPVEAIRPLLPVVEMVTFIAVDPGWGGGEPDEALRDKIETLRTLCDQLGYDPLICIDGGITLKTYATAAHMNPNIIVSGSAVFKGGGSIQENLKALTEI